MKLMLSVVASLLVVLWGSAVNAAAAEVVSIASGQGAQAPKQPQACMGPNDTVHLVYGIADQVYYCRSSDGGASFAPPQRAFQVANMSLGMRRGPRIVCHEGALIVTAIGGVKGKGQDGDLCAWRSADEGATWQGPVRINEVVDSAREGLHAMALAPDGTAICVWLDLRAKRTELYAACSPDSGATWSENVRVYQSPGGSICECCHPSLAVGSKAIHVMFRNSLAGNRDMYLTSSVNNQSNSKPSFSKPSFSKAVQLGTGHWSLNACPMDGGMLAVDSAGEVSTVWRRAGELFCTSPGLTGELSLGRGEQPWIASSAQGPVAVWTEGRVGDLRLKFINRPETAIRTLDTTARDPMIVGREGRPTMVVCWESITDSHSSIVATQILVN